MENLGVRANIVTYNAMINGLCKNDRFDEAVAMMKQMEDSGLKADVVTYTVLIFLFFYLFISHSIH